MSIKAVIIVDNVVIKLKNAIFENAALESSAATMAAILNECLVHSRVTAWKVSKYGVISGPYFPVFGLEITPYLDIFHALTVVGKLFSIYQTELSVQKSQSYKERKTVDKTNGVRKNNFFWYSTYEHYQRKQSL